MSVNTALVKVLRAMVRMDATARSASSILTPASW
jgi:hypothetical protein